MKKVVLDADEKAAGHGSSPAHEEVVMEQEGAHRSARRSSQKPMRRGRIPCLG